MYELVSQLKIQRRLCTGAAAILLVLAATGCERSPTTSADTKPPAQSGVATAKPAATAPVTQPATTSQAAETPRTFIAYYLHRTIRCPTCLSIEKQSREAIEAAYSEELRSGRLAWHAVDFEEPGHEHFEHDFELQSQSLVLVEMTAGRVARWKLLPQVWDLVDDPHGFQEYVTNEVAGFLGGD